MDGATNVRQARADHMMIHPPSPRASHSRARVALLLLFLTGCSSMPAGQRIALLCNPVAHASDLALGIVLLYTRGGLLGLFPGYHCVNAINDKVQQREEEKKRALDCPSLDPVTRELLARCDLLLEGP
jgi:hypothetical protein